MRVDGKQIFENFTEGDTRNLRTASDRVAELSNAYVDRGMSIKGLQERMKASWTGSSADAANAGAGPLEQAFRETADPLFTTRDSVTAQADSFDESGHTVVPVPDKPEKPNPWTTGLKGAIPIAGPFMVNNDIKNYQEGVAQHEAANQNNVRVMDQYDSATSNTRSALPTDYGVLKSDGANVSVTTGGGPPPITPPWPVKPPETGTGDDENDSTETSSTNNTDNNQNQNQNKPGVGDDRPVNPNKPGVGEDRPVYPNKPGDGITTPTKKPGTGDTTIPTGTGKDKPGRTTENPGRDIGRTPGGTSDLIGINNGLGPNSGPGGSGPSQPGTGSGRGTPGPGNAASRLLGGEGGPGGRGGGPGGAGSGGLGAGKGTGMGGMGGMGGADHLAGGRGAGGRGGGQMGPMGAGGRRAEGDEDEEHQRPDFLIEADPDAIFGTDQRTSPPVIGE